MTGMLVLMAALATAESLPEAMTYSEARKVHIEQRVPLVVLVGASWCPACHTMSESVLPSVSRRGGMKGVAFAVVDVDKDQSLARQLMQGSSVPQLVVYYFTPEGSRRAQLTGAQSVDATERFIKQYSSLSADTPVSLAVPGPSSTWTGMANVVSAWNGAVTTPGGS